MGVCLTASYGGSKIVQVYLEQFNIRTKNRDWFKFNMLFKIIS